MSDPSEDPARVRAGASSRPPGPPAPARWRVVLDALLPEDGEILERLAARGRPAGADAAD